MMPKNPKLNVFPKLSAKIQAFSVKIQIEISSPHQNNKKEIEIIYLFFISKGEIRTLDLTGMSRALSPAELPCHKYYFIDKIYNLINKIKFQAFLF